MHHKKSIVILGIWVIALSFLGFSESLIRVLLILTGFLLIVLVTRKKPFIKSNKDFVNQLEQAENSKTENVV